MVKGGGCHPAWVDPLPGTPPDPNWVPTESRIYRHSKTEGCHGRVMKWSWNLVTSHEILLILPLNS